VLTNLLLETIVATAKKSGEEGRIVNLASDAYKLVGKKGIPYNKLNDAKRSAARLPFCSCKLFAAVDRLILESKDKMCQTIL
jgi:hypothetical protein